MKKLQFDSRNDAVRYHSYVVGFGLSVVATFMAYFAVVNQILPPQGLVYVVLVIAVLQLITQVVFFLHIGRGSRWKLITFVFTILVVSVVVIGSIWVMNHLNYNMMDMNANEQRQYMSEHEGI